MNSILLLAAKDLRLMARDKTTVFWVIGFPLLMAVLFGAVFGGSGGQRPRMKVAVVDEDGTEESRSFAAHLEGSPALLVSRLERDPAIDGVRSGTLTACVALKRGFSRAAPFVSPDPALEIGVDPARTAEAGHLQGLLMRGLLASSERLGAPQRVPAWDIPIIPVTRQTKHPASAYQISFTQAVMWALFSCVLSFAVSIVQEREKGTLLRLRIAPVTRLHILGGKAAACAVSGMVVASGLLVVAGALFGLHFPAPHLLALALVCSVLCFTGIMMLLSVSGSTAQGVGGASSAVMMVLMMLGGGMIPLVVMPAWMQTIGTVSPVKWAVLAIEGAMWRQFTAAEMALPCAVLLATATVAFGAGAWRLARMDA